MAIARSLREVSPPTNIRPGHDLGGGDHSRPFALPPEGVMGGRVHRDLCIQVGLGRNCPGDLPCLLGEPAPRIATFSGSGPCLLGCGGGATHKRRPRTICSTEFGPVPTTAEPGSTQCVPARAFDNTWAGSTSCGWAKHHPCARAWVAELADVRGVSASAVPNATETWLCSAKIWLCSIVQLACYATAGPLLDFGGREPSWPVPAKLTCPESSRSLDTGFPS